VKVLFGQVEAVPLREGLNVVWNPLYDIVIMDTRVQKHTTRYDAASKDLQAVHVEMVLNYRLVPDRAPEVYKSIGLNYSSVIIDPAAQEVLKAQTAHAQRGGDLVRRQAIKSDVQAGITQWLTKYGVELRRPRWPTSASTPTTRSHRGQADRGAEGRAEALRADPGPAPGRDRGGEREGPGDAAREEARGVAEALRLKGDAEAAYNARVAASLTPVLIQQQYLARWDGRLPQYTLGGSGAVPFLQIPTPSDGRR